MMSKERLVSQGHDLMSAFCKLNDIPAPDIRHKSPGEWQFKSTCAYYRPTSIVICAHRCASIGTAGRQWSFPGYTVDRTPYGVIQHELGHHVDYTMGDTKGSYWSDFGWRMRERSKESPITSYCPNDAEWFAEMFRLFVTNPDLLSALRPKTFNEMRLKFKPVFSDGWMKRMEGAPERTILAAQRKILAA